MQNDDKSKTTARLIQRGTFKTIFRLTRPTLFMFRCCPWLCSLLSFSDSARLNLSFCLFLSLAHSADIGVECHSLAKLLSSKVYWKGIDFSNTQKASSLKYVDVSQAYEAIKGGEYLPDLEHVTVKSSIYGVKSDKIKTPLTISHSSIRDNKYAGIQIKGISKALMIQNTSVGNTTNGDGLSYSQVVPDPVEFCSLDVNVITFPINLEAFGKARTNVECTKVKHC